MLKTMRNPVSDRSSVERRKLALDSLRRLDACLAECRFQYVLYNDVSLVAPLVEFLAEKFRRVNPDSDEASRVSVCLFEALTNAINHGNFEIDSALREDDDNQFDDLIRLRQHQPPYAERRVFVEAALSPHEARFVIRDEGPGFDTHSAVAPGIDLDRLSGRGMLLIRAFMDEVQHNERGNEITMIKRC